MLLLFSSLFCHFKLNIFLNQIFFINNIYCNICSNSLRTHLESLRCLHSQQFKNTNARQDRTNTRIKKRKNKKEKKKTKQKINKYKKHARQLTELNRSDLIAK